jgi:hypothetical protein
VVGLRVSILTVAAALALPPALSLTRASTSVWPSPLMVSERLEPLPGISCQADQAAPLRLRCSMPSSEHCASRVAVAVKVTGRLDQPAAAPVSVRVGAAGAAVVTKLACSP